MTTYVQTNHFKLVDAKDIYTRANENELTCIGDELAEDCVVRICFKPISHATKDSIEEVYIKYGLSMDSKTEKDSYIINLIEVLEDALDFKKKVNSYLDFERGENRDLY